MSLPSFLLPVVCHCRTGGGRRAVVDPPAQPAAVPRGGVGGDGLPAARPICRSRRILQLRDLLLLALRMLCLVLFGVALARPFFTGSAAAWPTPTSRSTRCAGRQQPEHGLPEARRHAAGRRQGEGQGGDRAVAAGEPDLGAADLRLGRAASATSRTTRPRTPWRPWRRSSRWIAPRGPTPTIDLALEACRRLPTMPAKQIVLVTDQQVATWPAESLAEHLKQLPCPMQVMQVAPDEVENAWIADFKLRDGMADLQTPAMFVATIGYQGPAPAQRRAGDADRRRRGGCHADGRPAAGSDARGRSSRPTTSTCRPSRASRAS